MKKRILVFVTIFILILTSCKKTVNPQFIEEDIPLSFDTTTVILNNSKISAIKEVYPTYMVVAGKNLGSARATGNISAINLHEQGLFLSAPNSKFPQGSFEKIQSITALPSGDFKIGFAPFDPFDPQFTICEALEAGNHKEIYPVTNKVDKITDDLGNFLPISFDGGKLKIEFTKTWDWDGNTTTTNDKVEVTGTIKTNLDLDVDLRVKNWKVEKFKTELKLKYDGELKAKATLPLIDEKKTWNIYNIYLQPVTVLVGGVFPIVLNPVVKINANISAKGEVSLEGTLIKYAADFSKGIEYTNTGGFKVIGTDNFPPLSTAIAPALTASYEGEFKVSPELSLDLRLYNKDGIAVSAGLGLYGKAKFTAEASTSNPNLFDLNAEIKLGMEGKVKGKLKIFNKEIADKEISFTIAEITLWDQKKFIQNWNSTPILLSHYKFDGGLTDNGVLSNPLLNFNSNVVLSIDRKGIANKCYNFLGSGKLYLTNTNTQFNISNGFTIMYWTYSDGGPVLDLRGSTGAQLDIEESFQLPNFTHYFRSNTLPASSFSAYINTNAANEISGKWNHWCISYNKTTGRIKRILNGISVTDEAYSLTNSSTLNLITSLTIGNGFRGRLDEIRIYSGSLTTAAIQNIYNLEK